MQIGAEPSVFIILRLAEVSGLINSRLAKKNQKSKKTFSFDQESKGNESISTVVQSWHI